MAKAKEVEVPVPAEPAPGEFGPITWPEFLALPEDVRQRRAKRVYEKTMALMGTMQIELDIDEARGRNHR
jgi:hypothetical protein